MKKYYDVTRDKEFLLKYRTEIELSEDSVIATMKEDGLTEAKNQDGNRTKYIQDNTLVWKSLDDMVWLEENVFNDSQKAAYYKEKRDLNAQGLENMYMADKKEYIVYYTPTATLKPNWNIFYADAVSEIFPMRFDCIDFTSQRAIDLYCKFNTMQPAWVNIIESNEFPWMEASIAAAKMNDKYRVNEQLANMKKKYLDTGRKWPWFINESGSAAWTAGIIRDRYNLALNKTVSSSSNSENELQLCDGKLFNGWISAKDNNEWVMIDLGTSKLFNRLILKWGSVYSSNYKISVSNDGLNFEDAYVDFNGNGETDDIIFNPKQNRYIKLNFLNRSECDGINLKEVEVYYEPKNLAKGKTVSSSTQSEAAVLAVDNSTTTVWMGEPTNNQWYKIDLGSEQAFNRLMIDWDYYNFDADYSIMVSNDNVTYNEAKHVTEGKGAIEEVTFDTTTARYVKLVRNNITDNLITAFFEVRIFNDNHISGGSLEDKKYTVKVNNYVMNFDVQPVLIEDRLMVPLRSIFEKLGATVIWNDNTQSITACKNDKNIYMTIDDENVRVNGVTKKLDVAPVIINDRTLVPLRFVSESLGAEVTWNECTSTASIIQ